MLLVLPICFKDAELAIANLEWQEELACGTKSAHDCLIAYEESTHAGHIDKAREIAGRVYNKVELFLYPDAPVANWPQAPNWAWQNTARYVPRFKTHWLWLEADAIPLKPGWLEALDAEYRQAGMPLMGAQVEGVVPGSHINGVAIYPADVAHITTKGLLCEKAAWDVVMAAETQDKRHNAWKLIDHNWGIVDGKRNATTGDPPTFKELQDVYNWVNLDAVLFHRCKDTSLIKWLRHIRSAAFNVPQLCEQQASVEPQPDANATEHPPVEIFIVSYSKDLPWLHYCLRAIEKFCTGFTGITLVVPKDEKSLFKQFTGKQVRLVGIDEPRGKGHLSHMLAECSADLHTPPGIGHVLHVDSDCIFKMPTTPSDFFVKGKPIYIIRTYESLKATEQKVGSDCVQWQPVVERMIGWKPTYYTMCRHPTINDVRIFPAFREWVSGVHKRPFAEYWMDQRNDFPPSVCEYPALGAFAFEFFHDSYHWIDSEKEAAPADRLYQFWSHGGITPQIKKQIEGWLK